MAVDLRALVVSDGMDPTVPDRTLSLILGRTPLLQRYERVFNELQGRRNPFLEPVLRGSVEGRHWQGMHNATCFPKLLACLPSKSITCSAQCIPGVDRTSGHPQLAF